MVIALNKDCEIDENIGFLTMPITSGESCDLYMTTDGGNTFSKLDIIENDIYDYYHLPTQEDGKIYIKITQGTDGDSGEYIPVFILKLL